jgi:hypothetical protein
MAHDPAWHAEYLRLENAEASARIAYRSARGKRKEVALEALRVAGAARFDFEMAATKIVNIADLPVAEWARALRS